MHAGKGLQMTGVSIPMRRAARRQAESGLAHDAAPCACGLVQQQAPEIGLNRLVDEAHEAYAVAIGAGASRAAAIEAACAFYSRRRSELGAASDEAASLKLRLRRVK